MDQWNALDTAERDYWLQWEAHRVDILRIGLDRAIERSHTADGKIYSETVIMNLLIELVNIL